ncbi:ATP-binding protein [Thermogemmatispora sp.]|uniref:ATP-binding protein n=1 Tax=Thermogemmatispora sp. TaxID=1968838 RepID=UPI001D5D4FD2|nr:ATP-binding protein [Thermogemmatispora sp.]MBX5452005.1 AAA family ATPase [Thermogemmatispora sp.]
MAGELFVNREAELQLIDEALQTLRDRQRLLRTPVVELCGVRGIGKTALLRQVQQRCLETDVPCIWTEAGREESLLASQIAEQVRRYQIQPGRAEENGLGGPDLQRSVEALRLLAQRGRAVLLVDAVDAGNEHLLRWLEALLRELLKEYTLFVVLAASRLVTFEHERSVARKMTVLELGPLDRPSCEAYFQKMGLPLGSEARELVFSWTRGYPLAMEVLTGAIRGGLDPFQQADRLQLLQLLAERVIRQEILRKLLPQERPAYESLLRLLSVPRRFNLLLLQELIEKFEPRWTRESPLDYFFLPRELSDKTEVVRWHLERSGYAVVEPVRQLFLLILRSEQPELFVALHRWLATFNQRLAGRVSGSDRIRYLREWLYHSAFSLEPATLAQDIQELLAALPWEAAEARVQFVEEVRQDQELQEALGEQAERLLTGLQALEH